VTAVGVVPSEAGDDITIAAIRDSICVVQQRSISCNEETRAVAGELFGAAPVGCDRYHVLGAVPDGVTELLVNARAEDATDSTLPVRSNIYEGNLNAGDTVITGLNNAGEAVFKTELPLDWYAATNDACKRDD
jgi:hypothetical protein